jgi:hypothetical protein
MSSRQNFDYVEWHAWYSDTQKSYQSDISYQSDMKMNKQTHKKIISYKSKNTGDIIEVTEVTKEKKYTSNFPDVKYLGIILIKTYY